MSESSKQAPAEPRGSPTERSSLQLLTASAGSGRRRRRCTSAPANPSDIPCQAARQIGRCSPVDFVSTKINVYGGNIFLRRKLMRILNDFAMLGDAEDKLRSDWREGTGPSKDQTAALREARQAIAQAKAALDRAAG